MRRKEFASHTIILKLHVIKQKLSQRADNRLVDPRGKGLWREGDTGKGGQLNGETFDGEYNAVYTDAALYGCTPETYIT